MKKSQGSRIAHSLQFRHLFSVKEFKKRTETRKEERDFNSALMAAIYPHEFGLSCAMKIVRFTIRAFNSLRKTSAEKTC